jgi:hypothetical protein
MMRSICLVLAASSLVGAVRAQTPTQAMEPNKIGYPTVAAALEALKTKPGAKQQDSKRWIIFEDAEGEDLVLWSFTLTTHQAHPSVVKRTLQKRADGYYIDMNVRCEAADKSACGALVQSFRSLNEQVRKSLQEGK